jgi:hypothetical protein
MAAVREQVLIFLDDCIVGYQTLYSKNHHTKDKLFSVHLYMLQFRTP